MTKRSITFKDPLTVTDKQCVIEGRQILATGKLAENFLKVIIL